MRQSRLRRIAGLGPVVAALAVTAASCASTTSHVSANEEPPTPRDPKRISVNRPSGGTLRSADGLIDCGTIGGGKNACGPARYESSVTFTAAPDPGFRFTGWAADCGGTMPSCTIDMRSTGGDKWVAALFEPAAPSRGTVFRVTLTRPTGGIVTSIDGQLRCGSAANANVCGPVFFGWKEVAGLRATPDPGYEFQGWSGDCDGTGRCHLSTDQAAGDKQVAATFSRR